MSQATSESARPARGPQPAPRSPLPAVRHRGFVELEARLARNGLLPGTNLYWVELEVGPSFPDPAPGQFVMLAPATPRSAGVLLSRPFSIARAVRLDGPQGGWRLGILYTRVGRGTDLMARDTQGPWRVLGPLGRGFPLDHTGPALLVGGGRGVAPLVFLAEHLESLGRGAELLIGARSRREWVGPAEMGASLERTRIWAATEDGSLGQRGRVLDAFASEPSLRAALDVPGAALHVCGPHGLLEATGRLGSEHGVPAYASIEAYMACGTGICRTCVVPRNLATAGACPGSNSEFLMACLDGPVVPAECVDWARDRDMTPLGPPPEPAVDGPPT